MQRKHAHTFLCAHTHTHTQLMPRLLRHLQIYIWVESLIANICLDWAAHKWINNRWWDEMRSNSSTTKFISHGRKGEPTINIRRHTIYLVTNLSTPQIYVHIHSFIRSFKHATKATKNWRKAKKKVRIRSMQTQPKKGSNNAKQLFPFLWFCGAREYSSLFSLNAKINIEWMCDDVCICTRFWRS